IERAPGNHHNLVHLRAILARAQPDLSIDLSPVRSSKGLDHRATLAGISPERTGSGSEDSVRLLTDWNDFVVQDALELILLPPVNSDFAGGYSHTPDLPSKLCANRDCL